MENQCWNIGNWNIPIFLPGKFHGQRSLMGYRPWGPKEPDTTGQLTWEFFKTLKWLDPGNRKIFPSWTCLTAVQKCGKQKVYQDNKLAGSLTMNTPESYFPCIGILATPPEKAMAPHSSTFAWKIPWTEEPGRLQSMGSLRVGHD